MVADAISSSIIEPLCKAAGKYRDLQILIILLTD